MARIFRAPIFQQPKQAAITGKTEVVQDLLLTTLGIRPFYQLDWAVPRRFQFRDDWQPQNLLGTTLGITPTPFYQLDWATPQGYQRRVEWAYQNLLETTLAEVQAPFYQLDWPVPNRNLLSVDQVSQNLLESTLFQPPFTQMDWPNPAGKARPPETQMLLDEGWILRQGKLRPMRTKYWHRNR